MPDFNFKSGSFPIAEVIQAAQRKAQIEQQNNQAANQQLIEGLQGIGSIGQSIVDRKNKMAQALALGKQYDIPSDQASQMTPEQVQAIGATRAKQTDITSLLGSLRNSLAANGMTQGGAQPASGSTPPQASPMMLTGGSQPSPDLPPTPPPPAPKHFVSAATANLMAKLANANKPEKVMTQEDALTAGSVPKGTRIIAPRSATGGDVNDPKYQAKLESQYTGLKAKALSNRSGGLGLEDAKVDAAIHLRKAINQQYDPKTGEYNIPPSLHSEFVLGLARLMSPTGTIGIQLENELRQKTAREGAANALIYLGFDPKQVGGTTQNVAKFFVDQIDRQGQTAEQNRQGYFDYIHGQAPTDLDPARVAAHDRKGLNSFNDLLSKSPDQQPKATANPSLVHLSTKELMDLRKKMTAHKDNGNNP